MKPLLRRTALAAGMLLVPALTLIGCSDDAEPGASSPQSSPASSPAPATAPTPGRSPAPSASPGARSAPPALPPAPAATDPAALHAFTVCMRRHGYDIPDPPQTWSPPAGFDANKAQAAMQKCVAVMTPPPHR